jgi:hypothetical protein
MDKLPSVLVATTQAAGGIAGQFIGPQIYGGGADWTSILASHGAGFAVGVLVNFLAFQKILKLTPGPILRGYSDPKYTLMGYANDDGTIGIGVDQGLQWLTSVIVLAVMRRNTRTFLMDLAASTVGQGLGGLGGGYAIAKNAPVLAKLSVAASKAADAQKAASGGGGGGGLPNLPPVSESLLKS